MDRIETLGEAYDAGWRLTVRCARRREGLKSARPCVLSNRTLDLGTMVWTHGRDCPLAWLDGRLRCPQCGTKQVFVLWSQPGPAAVAERRATR